MVKLFVVATVLTIGLSGYAVAQDTAGLAKPMTSRARRHMHQGNMHPNTQCALSTTKPRDMVLAPK